jgi:hypothetical protein
MSSLFLEMQQEFLHKEEKQVKKAGTTLLCTEVKASLTATPREKKN